MGTEHLPYLNRHICRLPVGPWRDGCTSSNLVRLPGSFDIDHPVSRKELLRFREHAVRNWLSVIPRANDLRLLRPGQPLRVHKNTGIVKLLVEALHKLDV